MTYFEYNFDAAGSAHDGFIDLPPEEISYRLQLESYEYKHNECSLFRLQYDPMKEMRFEHAREWLDDLAAARRVNPKKILVVSYGGNLKHWHGAIYGWHHNCQFRGYIPPSRLGWKHGLTAIFSMQRSGAEDIADSIVTAHRTNRGVCLWTEKIGE